MTLEQGMGVLNELVVKDTVEVHARGLDPAAVIDAFVRELTRQVSALAKGGGAS